LAVEAQRAGARIVLDDASEGARLRLGDDVAQTTSTTTDEKLI
jgi:hypothetical protein